MQKEITKRTTVRFDPKQLINHAGERQFVVEKLLSLNAFSQLFTLIDELRKLAQRKGVKVAIKVALADESAFLLLQHGPYESGPTRHREALTALQEANRLESRSNPRSPLVPLRRALIASLKNTVAQTGHTPESRKVLREALKKAQSRLTNCNVLRLNLRSFMMMLHCIQSEVYDNGCAGSFRAASECLNGAKGMGSTIQRLLAGCKSHGGYC